MLHRLSLLTLFLLLPATAHATVLLKLTTADLTRQAQLVARGKVVSQRVVLDGGRPWTDTTIRLAEVWKGALATGAALVVRQPGGETGKVGMRVAGVARFSADEEVLVFTRPIEASGRHLAVGMCQGKYRLYRDAAGTRRAHRELDAGLAVFDGAGKMQVVHAPHGPDPTLAALLAEVRAALQGGAR